jgi:hypothetical protein
MKSKFKWIFFVAISVVNAIVQAQEKLLSGVVSMLRGSLPDANVVVKGNQRNTN